jgi:cytochrome c peroxidase
MRRTAVPLLLLLLLAALPAWLPRGGWQTPGSAASERVRAMYLADLDSLSNAVAGLARLPPPIDSARARVAFRQARRAYKRIEFLIADLLPDAVITLDGPPLPRPHETVADATLPPTGLQVVEGALFPAIGPHADTVLAAQARLLQPTLASLRAVRVSPATADARIFDAARNEIARVSTLGLAGFDATVSGDAVGESAEALRGMRAALAAYEPRDTGASRAAWTALDRRLASAVAALETDVRFERFDRLGFLVQHAKPVADALTRLQVALAIPRLGRPEAWSTRVSSIFDAGALDPFDYAPSDAPALRPELVALGRRLFFDPRLSAGDRRSCATCHQPAHGFADARRRARVDAGSGVVRNVPTLLNAGLQPFQFADQRSRALEDQVAVVLQNPREMNQPLDVTVAKLRRDTALAGRFVSVYGGRRDQAISGRRVQTTLAAFVRSLIAVDSRFDRAVRGDIPALSGAERRGFNLFMGKAACGTCHFAPTFGGSLPPALLESEPEVIGVPARAVTAGAVVDPDPGVEGFDHAPIHRHAFKTPSLRNVALTAPYMHNGVYRTLEQVVDFYDRGGGAGIGIELANQTLSPEPLHLSRAEKRELVAFMRALTDTVGTSSVSPRWASRPGITPPADVGSTPSPKNITTETRKARK